MRAVGAWARAGVLAGALRPPPVECADVAAEGMTRFGVHRTSACQVAIDLPGRWAVTA